MDIKIGDNVKFWQPKTGNGLLFGTVVKDEIMHDSVYATIKPEDSEELVYLFYGAVWGFAPVNEYIYPWSPQSMARLRRG